MAEAMPMHARSGNGNRAVASYATDLVECHYPAPKTWQAKADKEGAYE